VQGRRFRRARPALTPQCPELLSGLAHDRSGWFKRNADAPALVEIGALGGNASDDILGS
jgi:hypothetical protein